MSPYIPEIAEVLCISSEAVSFLFQLFKRRNVELIGEDSAMFDSPLADSFVSSTTAGVSNHWRTISFVICSFH